jgi:hypothetical protein
MRSILPFALIVVFGAVAVWMRKLSPTVSGFIGLVSGATFVVFMFNNPDPRGRYVDAMFAMLGIGIGLQRLGIFQRAVKAFRLPRGR